MTDAEAIKRGHEARIVLETPIVKEAFAMIESNLVDEMAKASTSPDRAVYLRQLIISGRAFRRYLEQTMNDGKFSAEQVRQDEERKRWGLFRAA